MKEILLYGSIYTWSAESIIQAMGDNVDKDIVLRVNTPGGDVLAAYGIIAKFQEHTKRKTVKVDGRAASAGAFLCCYAENVEALDVSEFLFHRAAYSDYIERDPRLFTEDLKSQLMETNKSLRAAMESKFTAEQFLKVTGVTLDTLFDVTQRIDVRLSAQQAKKLGLISKITTITPQKKAEISAMYAQYDPYDPYVVKDEQQAAQFSSDNNSNNFKKSIMTVAELREKFPQVYADVHAEGVKKERDRVGSFMAFAHLDLETVKKGVSEGTEMGATQMAEFSLKAFQSSQLGQMATGSAPEVNPPVAPTTPAVTPEAQAVDSFEQEVYSKLGVNNKK